VSPVLAIAGGLFWTTFDGKINAVDAFATIGVVTVIVSSLMGVFHTYPSVRGIPTCFNRIQKYFALSEVRQELADTEIPDPEKVPSQETEGKVIEFHGASIVPTSGADSVLNNVNFAIRASQFTVLLGPVGSGKTTLLRAILGEAPVSKGQIWRKKGNFAYCGQKPWLRNVTIHSNIIGFLPFESTWYAEVVKACCLDDDLQQIAGGKGDASLAGSNGCNLSGGQKQRVVSDWLPWLVSTPGYGV
jgi:ABC-type multidrug transport system fused ATPase/permease subunit